MSVDDVSILLDDANTRTEKIILGDSLFVICVNNIETKPKNMQTIKIKFIKIIDWNVMSHNISISFLAKILLMLSIFAALSSILNIFLKLIVLSPSDYSISE